MKNLLLIGLVSITSTASTAALASGHSMPVADAWSNITWDKTAKDMPKGDYARGEKLESYGLCITCHGEQGIAPTRNAPNLAGNTALYTYKALMDYQSGLRNEGNGKASVMHAATTPMSKQDMADLAVYYAAQKLPAPTGHYTPPANIKKLVTKGDVSRMITPCASCHGVHGEGRDITPALAGQVPAYFIRTMEAYKHGKRTNDIHEGMAQFTQDLTDAEIQGLAEYYANLMPKHPSHPAGKE
ncbi:c-type cytochrome [Hydrogenovibrio sp. JE_KL2]|uniref:c-type cytochrome n=1 Tax=Hydrogenovibrio sp. JE_KL2 TaxID=2651188 RepID=UPI00128D1011|nr:c-type cytochrome [Hydrogenovibrio sp. JE_KL2]MPQ75436.1 c-type cytochrome [Hydrogenovibrio sp. JE_KL2]